MDAYCCGADNKIAVRYAVSQESSAFYAQYIPGVSLEEVTAAKG